MWTARQKQRSSSQKQFSLDLFQKIGASSSGASSLMIVTRDELQIVSNIPCTCCAPYPRQAIQTLTMMSEGAVQFA
jgi:hypothetical protein